MSRERIRLELERDDDDWSVLVAQTEHELAGRKFDGSGPADVLEQVGQELDELEIARIRRERGI